MVAYARPKVVGFVADTGYTSGKGPQPELLHVDTAYPLPVGSVAAATLATAGAVKQAANVAAVSVPFADLTAAANAFNAMRTAFVNAGQMAGP